MTKLKLVQPGQAGIGAPTIMDAALAARHGVAYVHLAALAIDLDRAYVHDDDPDARPLAWEVFLLERYLIDTLDGEADSTQSLLEDVCMWILDQPPDEQALGSQLVFAVFHALQRGTLPDSLRSVFHRWRAKPRQLMRSLDALWNGAGGGAVVAVEMARFCLEMDLEPPLAPPSRVALEKIAGAAAG